MGVYEDVQRNKVVQLTRELEGQRVQYQDAIRRYASAMRDTNKGIHRLRKRVDQLKFQAAEIEEYAKAMPGASYFEVVAKVKQWHRQCAKNAKTVRYRMKYQETTNGAE